MDYGDRRVGITPQWCVCTDGALRAGSDFPTPLAVPTVRPPLYDTHTTDSADFLATRPHTAAVIPGKPAGNPLQFIRVGPADLGSRAREQLRRAELAKRTTEPARFERQEDWQSNLDNWKSSRRKRVEHIIERCVEVRRMENEPSQPRAKSKTFNEMLEER
ncbi:uncharacterized protein CG43427-like, partial [Achroia grisella]|uniref:uncharacterized protein CG43427-like n=1 Tax=Achroia grisella TaxID=688607 RepID=UPI0027D2B66C